ncbi:MAG: hypothetical protein J6Y12_02340 [Lachnospiraceae bacterium]|nr:hypothetical protein [Lachnospiraceae bacterium]
MQSEFLTGYVKTSGHIVLEKAAVKENNVFYTAAGDLEEMKDDEGRPAVSGRSVGELASGFHHEIMEEVSKKGGDCIFSLPGKTFYNSERKVLLGPDMSFGSGCAGILAVSGNSYVWTQEGSGMCVIRITEVLGKSRIIKCLSSEIGGDTTVGLAPGSVLAVCPEDWADKQLLPERKEDNAFVSLLSVFSSGDIRDDAFFDRVLAELTDDTFKGCMAVLAVRMS